MVPELKPYPEYRHSRLPWIGRMPAHWEVRRNGRLFSQRNETGFPDLPILEVSLKTGVRVRDLGNQERKQIMADRAKYKRALRGDIAYNMMRLWQGAVGVAPADGLVSPAYVVAKPDPEVDSRYYAYLFRTAVYMNEVNKYSHGIVSDRNRLYWDEFKQMPSLFPPREEQASVASYLDRHAVLASRLTQNKRRIIELLDEERQAIVRLAVTRGLDEGIPLQASGVTWLGSTPRHWAVLPLRRRYSIELGKMLDGKRITGEHLVPYLRNTDVQWDKINIDNLPMMDIRAHEYDRYTLTYGDMLVCEGGDVGRSAFWEGQLALCGYQKALHRLRPINKDLDNPRFLFYLMYTASKQGIFQADGSENTIAHLTGEKLRRHRFAMPPRREQDTICAHLQEHLQRLDETTARVRREIELVLEYRARLVSDVVTGRFDVRHLSATAGHPSPDLDAIAEIDELPSDDERDGEVAEEGAVGDE